jgi:protein SCO1/2
MHARSSHFLWLFLGLSIIGILAAYMLKTYQQNSRISQKQLPILRIISPFQLTNQNHQPIDNTIFKDKISLVCFAFTRCPGPCPAVLQRVEQFQTPFKRALPYVQLITITVDPDYDTPDVLKHYSHSFNADPAIWSFLTGDKEEARRVVEKDFSLPVADNPPDKQDEHGAVLHSTRLALVDTQGRIREYYDAFDPELFPKVLQDVGLLLREAGLHSSKK